MLEETLARHGFSVVERHRVYLKVRHDELPDDVLILTMAYGTEPMEADVASLAAKAKRLARKLA